MSEGQNQYDTGINQPPDMICLKCNQKLVPLGVTLSYLDSAFPVELPACPVCGMLYIPEELATGKILHVEKSLEDK